MTQLALRSLRERLGSTLKVSLESGGATTWAEYKNYFERDTASTRSVQVVKIEEPAKGFAIDMMCSLVGMMQRYLACIPTGGNS